MVVGWAAIATVLVETVGMVWSPTKEAAVPNLVPKEDLEAANQLSLATTYGISSVLGGLVVAVLNAAVGTSLLPVTGMISAQRQRLGGILNQYHHAA